MKNEKPNFHVTCFFFFFLKTPCNMFLFQQIFILNKKLWSRILTADCRDEGVNLTPSTSRVTGAKRINDMIVIIEKRVILSRDSC